MKEFNLSIEWFDSDKYIDAPNDTSLSSVLFQQALGLGDAIFGNIVQILFGYKVVQGMRNPMLEATSPSDFWGRRWNVLVHSVMKVRVPHSISTPNLQMFPFVNARNITFFFPSSFDDDDRREEYTNQSGNIPPP